LPATKEIINESQEQKTTTKEIEDSKENKEIKPKKRNYFDTPTFYPEKTTDDIKQFFQN
jgi:hypothetical protein